jgi:hypothetical protein
VACEKIIKQRKNTNLRRDDEEREDVVAND